MKTTKEEIEEKFTKYQMLKDFVLVCSCNSLFADLDNVKEALEEMWEIAKSL